MSAISRKMGELGLGKELDALVQRPSMIENREEYMQDLRNPKTNTEGIKEQYRFWSETHKLIQKYKNRAKEALKTDPAYAEHYAEILELKTRKKNTKYEQSGSRIAPLLQSNPYGI
jgi:hypothetical protein